MATEEGDVRQAVSRVSVLGVVLFLAACAGDTRETAELQFRRDGWDVQSVQFSARPEGIPSWCHVENDLVSVNVHLVPGRTVLPLRGTALRVMCWNARGMVGQTSLEREETGRWPESVEVRLQSGPGMAQARPAAASVAPYRGRAR